MSSGMLRILNGLAVMGRLRQGEYVENFCGTAEMRVFEYAGAGRYEYRVLDFTCTGIPSDLSDMDRVMILVRRGGS